MAIAKVILNGVTQMDVTGKTVTAGSMLSGTTALKNDGTDITGNIASQAAQTIHPSTTDQTIASGKYLTGAQTIKAVTTTNLTAANIVQGVTVKIGDSTDDDCVASVTGTASSGGGYDDDYKALIYRSIGNTTLPDDLTFIGSYAFAQCLSLDLQSLPSGVQNIGGYAFYQCNALKLTSLPSGVTSIGSYAFSNCEMLALTSLPSGLTSISSAAFVGCGRITLSSLPSGITSINANAFSGCTSITLSSLPSGLTFIGAGAFSNCHAITLSSLPSSVTSIGNNAFNCCNGITSISCDGVITTFGYGSFNGSSTYPMQIAHASFPNMTVSSFSYAFGSSVVANACQLLEDADIGNTQSIAANAFANCHKLQTLIIRKSDSICTLNNVSAFTNTPMRGYNGLSGTIYVPSALISTYQTATNWSTLYNAGTVTFVAIEGGEYEL